MVFLPLVSGVLFAEVGEDHLLLVLQATLVLQRLDSVANSGTRNRDLHEFLVQEFEEVVEPFLDDMAWRRILIPALELTIGFLDLLLDSGVVHLERHSASASNALEDVGLLSLLVGRRLYRTAIVIVHSLNHRFVVLHDCG